MVLIVTSICISLAVSGFKHLVTWSLII
jgi:hypothetical protein